MGLKGLKDMLYYILMPLKDPEERKEYNRIQYLKKKKSKNNK